MTHNALNVVFLCIDNSVRSILAGSILCKDGGGCCNVYSAGSHLKDRVNQAFYSGIVSNGTELLQQEKVP